MVRPEGFEPPTYGFEARRSIQLSYGRIATRVVRMAPAAARRLSIIAAAARLRKAATNCPRAARTSRLGVHSYLSSSQ